MSAFSLHRRKPPLQGREGISGLAVQPRMHGEDPGRGEPPIWLYSETSPTEAIAKLAPEDRPLGELVQDDGPRPTFTPRVVTGPGTRADLVITAGVPARAYDVLPPAHILSAAVPVALTERAVIGDSIPVPPPGNGMNLGRGWSRYLAAARLTDRNRDERDRRRAEALRAQLDRGFGLNAAEFRAGMRHNWEERIPGAAWAACAEAGVPHLCADLLLRVEHYNAHPDERDRGAA